MKSTTRRSSPRPAIGARRIGKCAALHAELPVRWTLGRMSRRPFVQPAVAQMVKVVAVAYDVRGAMWPTFSRKRQYPTSRTFFSYVG
jgi:hypothetical protein